MVKPVSMFIPEAKDVTAPVTVKRSVRRAFEVSPPTSTTMLFVGSYADRLRTLVEATARDTGTPLMMVDVPRILRNTVASPERYNHPL